MARPARPGPGPRRTCVGCRRVADPAELTRIVRSADGTLHVGRTLDGRGAWLCQASVECFELAARQGGFARAFRTPIRPAVLDALRADLAGGAGDRPSHFVSGSPAARD